jgi:hypothetical protein
MTTLQKRLRIFARMPHGMLQSHRSAMLDAADAIDELVEVLEKTLAHKPDMNARDGPCCSEQTPFGNWVCSGCTCGNFDDAAEAQSWRDDVNAWQRQEPIRAQIAKYKE